jgi:3-deoxy-manno-octulosonate cytidylyltransferase (CMP-KDO synthetase)
MSNKSQILGVIPARYDSSRFPGKPLIDIKGKSMIKRVYDQCKKSSFLDEVIVATDDERIYSHVSEFGNVEMTSSKHLSGTDRVEEVSKKYSEYDYVINIQGDEPLINPLQIDQLCEILLKNNVSIATLAILERDIKVLKNINRVKVVFNKLNKALYFSRSLIPFERSLGVCNMYRHIGIYGFKASVLSEIASLDASEIELAEGLEQLRWMDNDFDINVGVTEFETPNVDVPEDVDNVLKLIETKYN